MGRELHKLADRKVASLTEPGIYGDGGSLFIRVGASSKRWLFIYKSPTTKRRREMGLGGYPAVSLAQAREKAAAARAQVADGIDPLEAKTENRTAPTFGEVADQYIEDNARRWTNAKYRREWRTTLERYAAPLWKMPVDQITKANVLAVLNPIWHRIPVRAALVRSRIEKVLDAAKAHGFRDGENPAAWRGNLALILPPPPSAARHQPAMPYEDVPAFMVRLREREALAARCLEFAILTVARTNEALGAQWDEIDLDACVWTIPAQRMKARREHRVPLSAGAIEVLRVVELLRDQSGYVFPGQRRGRPLAHTALAQVLERMNVTGATVHGFRSSFRGFMFEKTSFPSELVEMCLAHQVGSAVERAYRRGDGLELRKPIMAAWSDHCLGHEASNVVPLRALGGLNA